MLAEMSSLVMEKGHKIGEQVKLTHGTLTVIDPSAEGIAKEVAELLDLPADVSEKLMKRRKESKTND